MKKALIITYYWPPSGGSGVQRWLYFCKYLREYGWEPIIFTAENADYPVLDNSLKSEFPEGLEVISQPIWEPYAIYKKIMGLRQNEGLVLNVVQKKEKRSLMKFISVWIRGNLFIPDARKFWIRPSVKTLNAYLKDNEIDIMVSTSPPQTPHIIALRLKKKYPNIPWVADFRDPWTRINYFNDLYLSKWSKEKHYKLERNVLQNSDRILTVSNKWAIDFLNLGACSISVIPNGFEGDISESKDVHGLQNTSNQLIFSHVGILTENRNPVHVWDALKTIIDDESLDREVVIRLIGKVDDCIVDYIESIGLKQYLDIVDYVDKKKAKEEMRNSDILLLVGIPKEKGVVPGKFFEYLRAGRPILNISPEDADVAKMINDFSIGETVDFKDYTNTLAKLRKLIFDSANYMPDQKEINKYSRKNLTKELTVLFDEITL